MVPQTHLAHPGLCDRTTVLVPAGAERLRGAWCVLLCPWKNGGEVVPVVFLAARLGLGFSCKSRYGKSEGP